MLAQETRAGQPRSIETWTLQLEKAYSAGVFRNRPRNAVAYQEFLQNVLPNLGVDTLDSENLRTALENIIGREAMKKVLGLDQVIRLFHNGAEELANRVYAAVQSHVDVRQFTATTPLPHPKMKPGNTRENVQFNLDVSQEYYEAVVPHKKSASKRALRELHQDKLTRDGLLVTAGGVGVAAAQQGIIHAPEIGKFFANPALPSALPSGEAAGLAVLLTAVIVGLRNVRKEIRQSAAKTIVLDLMERYTKTSISQWQAVYAAINRQYVPDELLRDHIYEQQINNFGQNPLASLQDILGN